MLLAILVRKKKQHGKDNTKQVNSLVFIQVPESE